MFLQHVLRCTYKYNRVDTIFPRREASPQRSPPSPILEVLLGTKAPSRFAALSSCLRKLFIPLCLRSSLIFSCATNHIRTQVCAASRAGSGCINIHAYENYRVRLMQYDVIHDLDPIVFWWRSLFKVQLRLTRWNSRTTVPSGDLIVSERG